MQSLMATMVAIVAQNNRRSTSKNSASAHALTFWYISLLVPAKQQLRKEELI